MRPTSVASEADIKPGNRKGTNPRAPDRTRRTRRTAIVLRTPPPVLNSTAANCGPPFGTKRPQVQILSPRLYSRRSEALTRVGEGLSCCQYSSKIRQVQQRRRDLTCASKGLPQPALLFADRHRAGVRIDLQRHRHVCVAPDPHDHPRADFHVHQQRCASPPRVVNRHVVDPVNTRWTAHSGEAGSRLLAAVRAEMTSPNGGTPDNPAGVA